MVTAEVLDSPQAECGESPVWDEATRTLIWLDIPRGQIHRYDPAGVAPAVVSVGQPISCLSRRQDGGLVLGLAEGFALAEEIEGPHAIAAPLAHAMPGMKLNDGGCDPQGRLWAGSSSPTADRPWLGRLYRLGHELAVDVVLDEVGMSNGIGWSPDGSTMYYVDSRRQSLDAFRFDPETGTPSERRVLFDVPRERGIPDGLAIDADGGIWLAIYGSGTVVRISPDGREDLAVAIGTSQATSCAFGGAGMRTLFITSATEGFSRNERDEQPLAGRLYAAELAVEGLALTPFGRPSTTVASAAAHREDR